MCCNHWFLGDRVFSSSSFWADELVAEGLVIRQWVEEEGQYRYCGEAFAPREDSAGNERIEPITGSAF